MAAYPYDPGPFGTAALGCAVARLHSRGAAVPHGFGVTAWRPLGKQYFESWDRNRVHLVGIAGSGMTALARVLLGRGWSVTGSDLAPCPTEWIQETGIRVSLAATERRTCRRPPRCSSTATRLGRIIPKSSAQGNSASRAQLLRHGWPDDGRQPRSGRGGHARQIDDHRHGRSGFGRRRTRPHRDLRRGNHGPNRRRSRRQRAPVSGRSVRISRKFSEAASSTRQSLRALEPDHFDCYGSLAEVELAFGRFARRIPPDGVLLARQRMPGHATNRRRVAVRGRDIWARPQR